MTNLRDHLEGELASADTPVLIRAMQDAMIKAAEKEYGCVAEYAELPDVPQELLDRYASEEWRLGTRIPFEKELIHRFGWGEAQVQLSMKGEYIKDCRIYSDSLETEVFGAGAHAVTLIDYGCGAQLIPALVARGCTVTAVPYTASAAEILAAKPDGVVLSGGAGDPAENTAAIAEIAALAGKLPLFGVGLGHQMLAIALGAKTEKLPLGHRGGQPVRDLAGSRSYTTSQNHGYTVVSESVKDGVIRYVNVNDRSCEGIDYPEKQAFSVQFDPASSQDMGILFDRFIRMMGGEG